MSMQIVKPPDADLVTTSGKRKHTKVKKKRKLFRSTKVGIVQMGLFFLFWCSWWPWAEDFRFGDHQVLYKSGQVVYVQKFESRKFDYFASRSGGRLRPCRVHKWLQGLVFKEASKEGQRPLGLVSWDEVASSSHSCKCEVPLVYGCIARHLHATKFVNQLTSDAVSKRHTQAGA